MRIFHLIAIVLVSLSFNGLPAQDLDPSEVRQTIEQGVRYLKSRQRPDGKWEEHTDTERTGATALAILALIESGEPKDSPCIRAAMNFLVENPAATVKRNYSVSLQTMAFCLVDPAKYQNQIRSHIAFLEESQVKGNTAHSGGWYYHQGSGLSDLSNSQFSILALYEAERVGIHAKRETWQRAHRYWADTQNQDGSWGYFPREGGGSSDARGSMTCAGIASLIITSGVLGSSGATVRDENVLCFQPTDSETAQKIERGMEWMAKNFSVSENPRLGQYLYYYLYALERVGRMTNRRFIGQHSMGQHDWYREGAAKILALHDKIGGGWSGQNTGEDTSTAFSLLFLAKGRRPVLMSKIQYNDDPSWNVHPNDVNNLTLHVESQWKQDLKTDLTWQSLDLRAATVDDLLQAPVLHLSGNRSPLAKSDEETAVIARKLREYLEQGGFIFAEAQPNDLAFDQGFRELMSRVLPEPGYELTLLEPTHPIWQAEVAVEAAEQRPIEGISFGCRTSVVYIPPANAQPSLSCLWEVAQVLRQDVPYAEKVQKKIDTALAIGQNVLAYATNRELLFKYDIASSQTKRADEAGGQRGRIALALLSANVSSNPAPMALRKILYAAEANLGLNVIHRTEMLSPDEENLSNYPILFMHGRDAFQWSETQREKLRQHLEYGGFLFANAICSSKNFSDAFQKEMAALFPNRDWERIPLDDPLFSNDYGGYAIKMLEIRVVEQAPGRRSVTSVRPAPPELYGIRLANEDRWCVVFSPQDVSCALEKSSALECRGYTSESAMQVAINVLLYGLEHW